MPDCATPRDSSPGTTSHRRVPTFHLAQITRKLQTRERSAVEVDPSRPGGDVERLDRGPRDLRVLANHRAELRVRRLEQRLAQTDVLELRLVELVLQERDVQARIVGSRAPSGVRHGWLGYPASRHHRPTARRLDDDVVVAHLRDLVDVAVAGDETEPLVEALRVSRPCAHMSSKPPSWRWSRVLEQRCPGAGSRLASSMPSSEIAGGPSRSPGTDRGTS